MIELRFSASGERARVVHEWFSEAADEYQAEWLTGWLAPEKAEAEAIRLGAPACEVCDRIATARCNAAGQYIRWDAMAFASDHYFCSGCHDAYLEQIAQRRSDSHAR